MNECMSKEFTVCPQMTESFECVFIYMKRSVVCSQTTKLGFGIFLDFLSGKDIDVCVRRVMSSEEHPCRSESKEGGWDSLGCFQGGLLLDPDWFGRVK